MNNKITIEVWADVACPYCYIGKHKLQRALSLLSSNIHVDIIWNAYELNPSLSIPPTNQRWIEYIQQEHKISLEDAKNYVQKLNNKAQEVGLDINLERVVIANTSKALQLVYYAQKHNKASKAIELLFKAYFEEGRDVSCEELLLQLAQSVELPVSEVRQVLASNSLYHDVKASTVYADNEMQLDYIPFYRVNGKIMQGDLSQEQYNVFIESALQDTANLATDIRGGASCSSDGTCSL